LLDTGIQKLRSGCIEAIEKLNTPLASY